MKTFKKYWNTATSTVSCVVGVVGCVAGIVGLAIAAITFYVTVVEPAMRQSQGIGEPPDITPVVTLQQDTSYTQIDDVSHVPTDSIAASKTASPTQQATEPPQARNDPASILNLLYLRSSQASIDHKSQQDGLAVGSRSRSMCPDIHQSISASLFERTHLLRLLHTVNKRAMDDERK